MKNKQKTILIGIIVILLLTSSLAIFLSLNSGNNEPSDLPHNESPSKISKEIALLTNESWFFGVQEAINNYYSRLGSKDNFNAYYLLESEYRKDNNLTTSNAATELNRFNYTPTFTAEKIYYNPSSSVTYFFAQGYTIDNPVGEGDLKYYDQINFLVIKDENNKYVLKPLDDNIKDLENYAKSYNIIEVSADNNTTFRTSNLSNKNKTTYYISIFQDLLFLDPEKAYNLLDDETKEIFTDYSTEDGYNENKFLDYRDTIMIALANVYDNLDTSTKDGKKIYKRIDGNNNIITITETSIMDFKIGFDFNW